MALMNVSERYNFRTPTSDKARENVIFLRVCLNDAMSYTHTFCNILTHDFGDQPDIPATDLAKVHGSVCVCVWF